MYTAKILRLSLSVVSVLLPLVIGVPITDSHEYHDILEAGKKDWRLVFRGTANINQSVFEAYRSKHNATVEDACKGVDFLAACNSHYRNDDALDNWWMVKEVLFGIVKDGALVKTLVFNGAGSTYLDWFSQDRYVDSCYRDLKYSASKDMFSLTGPYQSRRRFFINNNKDHCQAEAGWFVALDKDKGDSYCDWEKNSGDYPTFLFSGGPTSTNWNGGSVRQADAIVVLVKYQQIRVSGQPSEYFDILGSGREWRLAFRATASCGVPVYEAYATGKGISEPVDNACRSIDWKAECKSHYRNHDALDNYNHEEIEQILFGVVDDGAIVKTITFDPNNTDMWSWFQHSQVIDSCWSDFDVDSRYFSIKGHREGSRVQRTFFIDKHYGGCQNDTGWLVAVDNALKPPCPWEQSNSVPRLLYAAGPQRNNWLNGANIHAADAFVILFKYRWFE